MLIFVSSKIKIVNIQQFYYMKKSKSFSSYGRNLDRRNSVKANPQFNLRGNQRTIQNLIEVKTKQPKWIQGFDRVTSREKPNSFQLALTCDNGNQANYEIKQNLIRTKSSFLPFRQQKGERLGNLIPTSKEAQSVNPCCKKHISLQRNQNIMTTRDLQNLRKSFHSMDFNKQPPRTNTYIKRPVGQDNLKQDQNEQQKVGLIKSKSHRLIDSKLSKVHAFEAYTKRDFLSDRKLESQGGPSYSGAQAFKVPLQKFKGGWKTATTFEFAKSTNKIVSRYDAECEPWFTKLGYNPKEKLTTKRTSQIDLGQQMGRKLNQVHSKYPIRLAI